MADLLAEDMHKGSFLARHKRLPLTFPVPLETLFVVVGRPEAPNSQGRLTLAAMRFS
jgi:hypothetical protein